MDKYILLKNRHLTLEKYHRSFLFDVGYNRDGNKKPVLIFLHGFKGFKDWGTFDLMMDYFIRKNFVFIKMNFSLNGTTKTSPLDFEDLDAFGNNNFITELDDVQSMIDHLFLNKVIPEEEWDNAHVNLIGHSRGGSIAILKGSEDKRVRSVISLAGVADLGKKFLSERDRSAWKNNETVYVDNARTGQRMPIYPQFYHSYVENKTRLDVINAAKTLKKLLIVHGTSDQTVPVEDAITLKGANAQAILKIIDHADHTFGGKHPYTSEQLPEDLKKAFDYIMQNL